VGAIAVIAAPPVLVSRRLRAPLGLRSAWGVRIASAVVVVLALGAVWWASLPLRADLEAAHARQNRRPETLEQAAAHARRATELASWEGSYWSIRAGVLDQAGRLDEAYDAGLHAVAESPWNSGYALAAAGLSERRGDMAQAAAWLAEARARDPHNLAVLKVSARFHVNEGSPRLALDAMQHAVEVDPDDAESWALLGAVHETTGDAVAAREAYERALGLDPDDPVARDGLARLDGTGQG
jgi:Flp pilus assembly protein TadD